jgi:hypothetical protein
MDRQKYKILYFLFLILIVINSNIQSSGAYKLNVPKVLLPFQSSKLISFVLEAKTETESSEDLCFVWSSSKPDVVAISPIYEGSKAKGDNRNECTAKAIVTAVSKHPQRMTSIILAKETSKFIL